MAKGLARKGFDIDLRDGEFRQSKFAGMMRFGKVEHKRDYIAIRTGNVFVELSQRLASGERVPSGFNITIAEWWAFEFLDGRWLVIRTSELKPFVEAAYLACNGQLVRGGDNNDYWGVLIPLSKFLPTRGA
jgi:hypothetical protein